MFFLYIYCVFTVYTFFDTAINFILFWQNIFLVQVVAHLLCGAKNSV